MSTEVPRALQPLYFERAAREYLESLPLEHFMEAKGQSRQREITLESLALLRPRRPDLQVFNEMLVQYLRRGEPKPGQVVPDNMVVLTDRPVRADLSYNVQLEPVGPFWVLEYVSKNSARKDYEDSFYKYERELKVPYYLIFYPDAQELTLYRQNKRRYVSVKPNEHGRYAIPELDLELALLEGWVRYWYRGELLPLPADLQQALDDSRRQTERARQQAAAEKRRADDEQRRADDEKRRADDEKRRADGAQRQVEELRQRLEALERDTNRGSTRRRPGS